MGVIIVELVVLSIVYTRPEREQERSEGRVHEATETEN